MLLLAPMLLLESSTSWAQSLFDRPPTRVMIHSPESTEGRRNRTTITVVVPEDAGNALGSIVLRQLPNLDQWDWGRLNLGYTSATIPFMEEPQAIGFCCCLRVRRGFEHPTHPSGSAGANGECCLPRL